MVGSNGSGKTTLFRVLTGQLAPDAGDVVIGSTVKFGYVQQLREDLNPNHTIFSVRWGLGGGFVRLRAGVYHLLGALSWGLNED